MRVLLISTYDLGHQPFALASLCAHLEQEGAVVNCNDLAVEQLKENLIVQSSIIAVHLAMHTATRLALDMLPKWRFLNPDNHICFFGLYAPMAAEILSDETNMSFIAGEFEAGLVNLYREINIEHPPSIIRRTANLLNKQSFQQPNRGFLPPLSEYAHLQNSYGDKITAGYTEASRGCKHLCRHCPVVPVYKGRFFIIPKELVLEDIKKQVAAGAGHISFGDPDFFNGPKHSIEIVNRVKKNYPHLGYDVTIKIEHLLKHKNLLPVLKDTGCRFITTAVESFDNDVLVKLEKNHTYDDFLEAVQITRSCGLNLSPTFIPFTPWTSLESYQRMLLCIAEQNLVENVAPIQLSIRLLIPKGSRLLELEELKSRLQEFDQRSLSYGWVFQNPALEELASSVTHIIENSEKEERSREEIFTDLWFVTNKIGNFKYKKQLAPQSVALPIPKMSEPWYCCAEPASYQKQV